MRAFCNTQNDFLMEKTARDGLDFLKHMILILIYIPLNFGHLKYKNLYQPPSPYYPDEADMNFFCTLWGINIWFMPTKSLKSKWTEKNNIIKIENVLMVKVKLRKFYCKYAQCIVLTISFWNYVEYVVFPASSEIYILNKYFHRNTRTTVYFRSTQQMVFSKQNSSYTSTGVLKLKD